MRIKGILFIVILIAIIFGLGILFTDQWLEKRMEATASALVGAKVEFEHVDFSFVGLHMRWDSLQVTNPKQTMKNILTTGPTEFNMALGPLLRKKVIIENVQMLNVTSGTDRTVDGAIPKKPKKESKPNFISKTITKMEADVAQAPAWNLDQLSAKVNVDSILAILDIRSPQKIDSLQQQVTSVYSAWDSTFQAVNLQQDFDYVETRVSSINLEKLKTLPELENTATTIKESYGKVDSLESFITTSKKQLQADLQATKNGITVVDDWIKADITSALQKAKLPSFSKQNIALFLFGRSVSQKAGNVLQIVNTTRTYAEKLKSDQPKKEKPPRSKGQWIFFSQDQLVPDWWVQNIALSGHTTKGIQIDGALTNLVADQRIIDLPTELTIHGARADGTNLQLDARFDYRQAEPQEKFNLALQQYPIDGMHISDSAYLPGMVQSGKANIQAALDLGSDRMQGTLSFVADQLVLDMQQDADNTAGKLVQRVVQNTNYVDVKARLQSDADDTEFHINSNLDDLLVSELKGIAGEQVDAARQKITDRVEAETAKYKQQFNALVNDNTQRLQAEIDKYENQLQQQKDKLAEQKTKLDKRIEEEKQKAQNAVEDEIKKRAKGLLK